MNYYPFNIGDYVAHTAHLNIVEDCAYRRLIDLYYLTENALPLDAKECARLVRMRENTEDVERVLREFFTETSGGWVNRRCDEEILKFRDKSSKAQASARESAKSRKTSAERTLSERSTDAKRTQSVRSTNVELTNNQEPITNTPPNGGDARRRARAAKPDDVSDSTWQDFQQLRTQKRAPLTDTALAGLRREAQKAGITLGDALAYCCEQGWQGFNASWYIERTQVRNVTATRTPPTKNAAAARAIFGAERTVIDV